MTTGIGGASRALAASVREVLLGDDPPVKLTQRAQRVMADARDDRRGTMHRGGTVITRSGTDLRWWTWAGFRANLPGHHT